MILLIDNYDSFTYNLYQYLCELGAEVEVVRNDQATLEDVELMAPEKIVISPGPCTPREAGISNDLIRHFETRRAHPRRLPGPPVHRFQPRRHRRPGRRDHARQDLARYTTTAGASSPGCPTPSRPSGTTPWPSTETTCRTRWRSPRGTDNGLIMGVRHKEYAVEGVQFHPESILTTVGKDLLRNFLRM